MKLASSQRFAAMEAFPESRRREPIALARVVAVVALGAVIATFPAPTLTQPGMVKFGWQMYAMSIPAPVFDVSHEDGTTSEVPAAEIAAKVRPDVDYVLPGVVWICRHDATAVRVNATIGGDDAGEFVCEAL